MAGEDAYAEDNEHLARVAQRPDRLLILDLDDTSENAGGLEAQFNPEEFDELLKADWQRRRSPGFSHQRVQYVGTDNVELTFELTFDALVEGMNRQKILEARQFLRSMCYARKGATNVREGEAPRAMFIWPNFLAMSCVIDELNFKYQRFDNSGAPTRYTVKVKVEQIVVGDQRIYLEDVREGRR